MRSKNGATTMLLVVFIIFLGTSFAAAQGSSDTTVGQDSSMPTATAEAATEATGTATETSGAATEAPVTATETPGTATETSGAAAPGTAAATTEAGSDSTSSAAAASVVTVDTVAQSTGDASSSVGGAEVTQESVAAVTTTRVGDGQPNQEQTTAGAGLSGASNTSPEQTTGEAGLNASAASQEQTTSEETTGASKAGLVSASDGTTKDTTLEVKTTEAVPTSTKASGMDSRGDGSVNGARPNVQTTEETQGTSAFTSVEEQSTEAPRGDYSTDVVRSSGRTTKEEPKGTSTNSSESTEDPTDAGQQDALTADTRAAQNGQPKQQDHLIGIAIVSVPAAAAVLALTGYALARNLPKLFSKGPATSPNKEQMMLEAGGPGEPDGASNPIPDAQIVGDEGPVPTTTNGGGQQISNPGDVENTKL